MAPPLGKRKIIAIELQKIFKLLTQMIAILFYVRVFVNIELLLYCVSNQMCTTFWIFETIGV